jgi:hypothetical protein
MTHTPSTKAAIPDRASCLGAWPELDWRFMLPDPHLGSVWLAPECADASAALSATGVDVVSEPGGAAVAFVDGSKCDFQAIERGLPPGALVRVTVQARGWQIADDVKGRGWQVIVRIWAAGGIGTASAYVDLDDRRAVMYWWQARAGRRGVRARLARAVRLTLARFGLWRLVCEEGFVFARTPL